jgi:tetratricopeptide (TPR) repeat protein
VLAASCDTWVARAASVEGMVEMRLVDGIEWNTVEPDSKFCPGDLLRVGENSRAAVFMANETVVRLDQNTTITFKEMEKKATSVVDILKGILHFISRVPRTLTVSTPFVNGTVEGTEFLVRVYEDRTFLSVFEGKVLASNDLGSIMLASGQSAIAETGKAPVIQIVARPRDAVQWALHYPQVIEYPEKGLEEAALLLSVGRVAAARAVIERALESDPESSPAMALQSIIAVVQNERENALGLANRAVEAGPASATARIALSYAQQASFDLEGALASLEEAVTLEPKNSLAWARLAELRLSVGNLDSALEAAKKAADLNPDLSRTQTVLGFAYLTKVDTDSSMSAFEKAISLDQADPLPRLGMGLALIRKGEVKDGREEIEIAAGLDPNISIVRSYLGKAFYEERREEPAGGQYKIAQDLDPKDPTAFFYDAILKQSINRPVEALQDLQKSIELNDNRAVYRSRLLLDDDLAARSASIARIYSDLGFQQLALVEGWKSVNTDPGNYSAHRFLADSYAALPRHEIARVSELLQSQLLQPLNVTPVQPQLGESNLLIFDGAGPSDLSFNEFNPLFNRNRVSLQLSAVAGSNGIFGDELVISGIQNKLSFSLGQFHYETDGFRENNDQNQDIYDVFAQYSTSQKTTSIQFEARFKEIERGHLQLFFNPDNYDPDQREDIQTDTLRFGLHHSISPRADIIASLIYGDTSHDFSIPLTEINIDEDGYMAEVQYLFRSERLKVTGGAGHFSSDEQSLATFTLIIPDLPPMPETTESENDIDHTNLYVYSHINYPETVTWTIGASADFFDGNVDVDQFNPKAGLTWRIFPATTLRAAVFRTLKRHLISEQTIEPTQVAGFNQFFDDGRATDAWRYSAGVDQKFSDRVYAGAEYSERDLETPGEFFDPVTFTAIQEQFDVDEEVGRAYIYWTPNNQLALSTEYQYERFKNPKEFMIEDIAELKTHKIIFGINYFHPSGFYAKLRPAYISQDGEFSDTSFEAFFSPEPFPTFRGEDDFWIVDASIGYRFPKRYGRVALEVRNLFDEDIRFQDTDPANPGVFPERQVLVKAILAF